MTASIIDYFSTLKDLRVERYKLHSLSDIIEREEYMPI